jgi:hypothetical protein
MPVLFVFCVCMHVGTDGWVGWSGRWTNGPLVSREQTTNDKHTNKPNQRRSLPSLYLPWELVYPRRFVLRWCSADLSTFLGAPLWGWPTWVGVVGRGMVWCVLMYWFGKLVGWRGFNGWVSEPQMDVMIVNQSTNGPITDK